MAEAKQDSQAANAQKSQNNPDSKTCGKPDLEPSNAEKKNSQKNEIECDSPPKKGVCTKQEDIAWQKKCDEYKHDLQRLAAEFDNYKKRSEREKAFACQIGKEEVLSQLLLLNDDFASATEHIEKNKSASVKADANDGIILLSKKLSAILASFGIKEISCSGEPNHMCHEVVLQVEGKPAGHIAQVLRRGYMIGERLLRAAQVSVYSGEETKNQAKA